MKSAYPEHYNIAVANHEGEVNPLSGCRYFSANPDKKQAKTTSEEDETLEAGVQQCCNSEHAVHNLLFWNCRSL